MIQTPPRIMVFALLASCAIAQTLIPRIETRFDVMLKEGGVMDLHTLEELDRTSRAQLDAPSEATVSKFDLKAPGRARREYNTGLRLLTRNDFKKAAERLKKATTIYPQFVAAHNALGCAYFSLGQNDLARQEFWQAIQVDDHLSSSYLNLGRAELALGHLPAALASMEKGSSIAPFNSSLLLALTYTQFLNHDYPAAIKSAQRAHSRVHSGIAVVHYFAAASWQAQNNVRETRFELQTFLAEDPTSPFAEHARRIVEEIQAEEENPSTPTLAMLKPADTSDTSSFGKRVLQDFREKQEIAEAEKAASICSSCDELDSPRAETEVSASREPSTGVSHPKYGAWTLRSAANEVAIFFTAADHGKSVSDLKQSEIAILDDKKPPAAVLGFRSESELPLRLGLIIDTSASITQRLSFEQQAAVNFLQEILTGKDDLAFVAGFSNSVVLVQDFTADLKELSHGINQLVPVGGTAIWDTVTFAVDKLAERKEGQPVARILVVISDGDDNSSSTTLKQAIEQAQRDEVIVYTVSTRYADVENSGELTGNRAMKVLAELTGGVGFFPGTASHLNRSLAELQQVIRSRYLISYRPALLRHDGRYRSIEITAVRSGHKLKVNARKGYRSAIGPDDDTNF